MGCLAALLSAGTVLAQPEQQRFRRITIDNGLSQSTVVTICQDSLGFLWFGTKDGLNLYDGYNFKVFHYNRNDTTSIGGNNIRSLVVDKNGDIWVGAGNGTLSRYSHHNQQFTRIYLPTIPGVSRQLSTIESLVMDREGYIWAATLADGVFRIDPQTTAYEHLLHNANNPKGLPANSVNSLLVAPDGKIWMGMQEAGLCRYDPKTKSFDLFTREDGLPDNRIYAVYSDRAGNIWVGTQEGAAVYDKGTQAFSRIVINPFNYPSPSVMAFAQTDDKHIWLSVYPQGVVKLNIETREWIHHYHNPYINTSLSYNDVRELFVDKTKNLWIGTNGGGISMLPLYQNFSLYRHIPNNPAGLPGNSIRSILEDSAGNRYIGLYGGLSVYNTKNNTYQHYKASSDDPRTIRNTAVYVLEEDYNGNILIGFEGGGLQIFDPKTKLFKSYYHKPDEPASLLNDHVLSIFRDSQNQIWVGTHEGLSLLDRATGQFKHYLNTGVLFSGPYIRSIIEDKPGYLWLGSDMGLIYLETATGKTVEFRDLSPAPSQNHSRPQPPIGLYSLLKDTDGLLWIGTQGSGLYKLSYQNKGTDFSRADFTCMCDDTDYDQLTIYGILEDGAQNLWMSSDNGLMRYGKKGNTWYRFTKTDGLQSNEFNASAYYKATDGRMYFGGINGLSAFYPDKLAFNTMPPAVALTNFKVFNKPYALHEDINLLGEIVLNHTQNYLTFEFAALDYTAPEKNQYAYQLVGFDKDWVYPGSIRQVTYSNLPPDNYVFKVKAANKDGYWNEEGVSVRVAITPAYYSTWWFRGLILSLILLVVYIIFRARLAGYRERQKLLEEQLKTQSQKLQLEKLKTEYAVSQALIEGQNQEQKRISEDLHDGLGQTLTAASLNLMALDSSVKNEQEEKTTEYLVNLQLLLNSAIQEVRNISHNLMPYLLAEEGLQAALDEMCHRAMKSGNLKIHLYITGSEERIVESQEINFYRIAQEIISNAQKHSGAQNLYINYNVGPNTITLVSEDDGIGFDPAYLQSARNLGLGIKNIQVRVQLMKGKINIVTKPGKGVKIEIEVPRL